MQQQLDYTRKVAKPDVAYAKGHTPKAKKANTTHNWGVWGSPVVDSPILQLTVSLATDLVENSPKNLVPSLVEEYIVRGTKTLLKQRHDFRIQSMQICVVRSVSKSTGCAQSTAQPGLS